MNLATVKKLRFSTAGMVSCFTPGCNHIKNQDLCIFFDFPKEKALFEQWISLISCPDAPTASSQVCSCHFINGDIDNKPTLVPPGPKRSLRIKKRLGKKRQAEEDKELIVDVDKGEADHTYFRVGREKSKKEIKEEQGSTTNDEDEEEEEEEEESPSKSTPPKIKKKENSPGKSSETTKGQLTQKAGSKEERKKKDSADNSGDTKKTGGVSNIEKIRQANRDRKAAVRERLKLVDWEIQPPRPRKSVKVLAPEDPDEDYELLSMPIPLKRMNRTDDIDEKTHFSWLIQPPNSELTLNSAHKQIEINTANKETQTPGAHVKLDVLTQAENYFLKRDIEILKEEVTKLKKQSFGYDRITGQEKLVTFYTGFPNKKMAELFFSMFDDVQVKYHYKWKVETLNRRDQMLMTLMKFRHNFSPLDLSVRFGISSGTVCNIAMTWIHAFEQVLPSFVQVEDGVAEFAPGVFTQCRMILDMMEVTVDGTEKNKSGLRGVVGLAANGMVIFTSQLHPSQMSCSDIIHESSLWEQLDPGDLVVAVREGILPLDPPPGIHTEVIPIPKVRMAIERTLSRIRSYEILNSLPRSLLNYASQVWRSCCFLANYHHPVIKQLDSSTFEQPQLSEAEIEALQPAIEELEPTETLSVAHSLTLT